MTDKGLVEALRAWQQWWELPAEQKRSDVAARLHRRGAAALEALSRDRAGEQEPVAMAPACATAYAAWLAGDTGGNTSEAFRAGWMMRGSHTPDTAAIRRQALEEAAKKVESFQPTARYAKLDAIAASIRSLATAGGPAHD